MDNRTVSSAHVRIDGQSLELVELKTTVKIQLQDLFTRVKRLEAIMIGTTGSIIALLLTVLMKM
tara:strand:+ start:138 stop:329 length:192 start_codon:yes stop_codon:yes gene_type:complete